MSVGVFVGGCACIFVCVCVFECVCVFDFVSVYLWECLGAGVFVWV